MPSQTMFLLVMVIGMLTTISSSSWFTAWMGMEMNALAFIPMLANQKNKMSNEAMLKYFLTQTLASALLLMPIMMMTTTLQTWTDMQNNIIFMALIMKMGAAPFHFWMPSVMEGLTWQTNMVLVTLQKIAPILMIMLIKSTLINTMALASIMVGALGGYNQTSLRKLLAYSSIAHMGGMLMMMIKSNSLTLVYLTVYIMLSMAAITMFMKNNMNTTTQTTQLSTLPFSLTMMTLLSMGGLPPFTGFYLKWLLISNMITTNTMLTMLLIATSMVTLFFYFRVTYTSFLLVKSNQPKPKNTTKTMVILTALSLMGLPLPLVIS